MTAVRVGVVLDRGAAGAALTVGAAVTAAALTARAAVAFHFHVVVGVHVAEGLWAVSYALQDGVCELLHLDNNFFVTPNLILNSLVNSPAFTWRCAPVPHAPYVQREPVQWI